MCEDGALNLKNSQDRIIFMSMFNDIESQGIREKILAGDTGRFSVLETKRKGMELFLTNLKENVTLQPLKMVEPFKDTGHPVCKSVSALSRGILKQKNGRDTVHFNADASNTELLFRIIYSVNQLRNYGNSFELL